jgi:hypothetical protein
MKHILNNISEQEKNAIREQHTGGMNVMTENFSRLLNSKLGDSKPLVSEQNVGVLYNLAQAALKPKAQAVQPQSQTGNDRISNLAGIMRTIQTKQVPQQVIVNPSSKVNNMSWNDYVTKFKITPQEIDQANALLTKMGQTSPIKGSTPSTPTSGSTATGGGKLPAGAPQSQLGPNRNGVVKPTSQSSALPPPDKRLMAQQRKLGRPADGLPEGDPRKG